MADPAIAIQGAVLTALRNAPDLTALVGTRVYDYVLVGSELQDAQRFPYVRVDVTQSVENDDECGTRWDVFVSVHTWSRSRFRAQTFNMMAAVRAALDVELPVLTYRLEERQFLQSRTLDDPDGITQHGIVEMRFNVSAA